MAAATAPRKTISIYDYPEHLNPFHEEDNHNKIRFWTLGRKLNRSNSITFSGIKDFKNSWAFRSFMKKGKKGQQTSSQNKSINQSNGETSPIVYRRAVQYSSQGENGRSAMSSPERYVYGGSVTPLPRSRFQERLRSPSQFEISSHTATPRMARSEISGSRLSVESTNPFDEDPVPPVRAARRKKKRAPPPPPAQLTLAADVCELQKADVSINLSNTNLKVVEEHDSKPNPEDDIEDVNLNIELRIVEDEDVSNKEMKKPEDDSQKSEDTNIPKTDSIISTRTDSDQHNHCNGNVVKESDESKNVIRNAVSNDDILDNEESFSKIDIVKYRRNSSLNEDDIRLRRGNLEDFHLANKRSKSLTIAITQPYMVCDLNLNDRQLDGNGNEEPVKVTCKIYEDIGHKQSTDTISSTEKEFIEIDRATKELEKEISKLNSALIADEDVLMGNRLSVSDIKRRFDKGDCSPNPIPKPRRSHYGGSSSPVTEHVQT